MTSADAISEGYALAYSEARRGLEDQERAVVELRARAGALMAAAAVATSFFGGQAMGSEAIGAAAWIAIGCFALLGFGVLYVLWPRRDWEFSVAPDELIATYLEPRDGDPVPTHMIERDLALHMGRSTCSNRSQLKSLTTMFRASSLLLFVEILAWIMALLAQR